MGGEHRSQVDDMTDLPLLWFLHRDLGRFLVFTRFIFLVQSRNQSFGQKSTYLICDALWPV